VLRNPYLNRMPVRDPARFYGRRREVRRILEGLAADPPQSFSVVGDRRIGKSSLLHQVQHPDVLVEHVPESIRPSMRLRYHDFQAGAPGDDEAFVGFLCGEVAEGLGRARPDRPSRDVLVSLLREAGEAQLRMVVLWDEFEVVTRHAGIGPDLYAFLRSLAQNHRLAFVVASGRDLRTVCHSSQVADSPFFNVFQTVRLRPLARAEAEALVREPSAAAGLPLEEHAWLAIDHLAGTFPFFAQIACAALFEHLDEEGGGAPEVRAVEARFLEEVEPHFRYVWEERLSEEERRVVAEAARGRITGTGSRRAADRLEREGYLVKQGDTCAPFSRCFSQFVREQFDEAEDEERAPADSARVATVLQQTMAEPSGPPRPSSPDGRPASPGPLGPGTVLLGKYRIDALLGEGGMGKVFLAHHVHLDRKVVVKVLGPQVAGYPDMITRFRREAMASSAIGHPNVVRVDDFDWDEAKRPFLVMEYLEGEDLAERIHGKDGRESRPLPASQAVRIIGEASDGLAAAHDRGIIHRDLKPSNLFLARPTGTNPDRREFVVKILDFGISKFVESPAQALTRVSSMLGTPCYMAPEQIADASKTGPAADQYALAVVLYECLTGRLPFEPGIALSRPFWPEVPPPPATPGSIRDGIPAALDEATLRGMAFRPEDRFPDVRAFGEALRRAAP
jgi:serine/threonine-protein kinase